MSPAFIRDVMEDKPLFENRKIAFIGPGAMAER